MSPLRIYSKVDRFYYWFIIAFSLFFLGLHIDFLFFDTAEMGAEYYSFLVISLLVIALLIALPRLTYFEFGEKKLTCHTLFFIFKKIPYQKIKKLERCNSHYAGLKFSTALKGLVLSFDKYDDVLVGPRNEKLFVEELLKRNDTIEVNI